MDYTYGHARVLSRCKGEMFLMHVDCLRWRSTYIVYAQNIEYIRKDIHISCKSLTLPFVLAQVTGDRCLCAAQTHVLQLESTAEAGRYLPDRRRWRQ